MTITTEEWMQHRRDGLTDALVDRGYPKGRVAVDKMHSGFLVSVASNGNACEFATLDADLSQAYRDGLAYINSLPQMEVS